MRKYSFYSIDFMKCSSNVIIGNRHNLILSLVNVTRHSECFDYWKVGVLSFLMRPYIIHVCQKGKSLQFNLY